LRCRSIAYSIVSTILPASARFVADASHESVRPCDSRRRSGRRPSKRIVTRGVRESLEILRKEVSDMKQIVEDLFTLTRADIGQLPLTPSSFYSRRARCRLRSKFSSYRAGRAKSHLPARLLLNYSFPPTKRCSAACSSISWTTPSNTRRFGGGVTVFVQSSKRRLYRDVLGQWPGVSESATPYLRALFPCGRIAWAARQLKRWRRLGSRNLSVDCRGAPRHVGINQV